jgi:hypothetical protein
MASLAEKRIVKFVFSGQGGPSTRDVTKLTQDVLALAKERGMLSGSLERREEALRGLLSEIGQAALQHQQDQQSKLGYEGSSRVCEGCGKDQKFVGHRPRTIETQLGTLRINRAYYHCAACGRGCLPYDKAEGLGPRAVSVSLAKVVVELAEQMPFRRARATLEVLLGRKLSDNTVLRITRDVGDAADAMEQAAARQVRENRQALPAQQVGRLYLEADGVMVHRTDGWHESKTLICRWQDNQGAFHQRHVCRHESAEDFAPLAWACAHASGLDNARQSVLLGDGIAWIWNQLGPIADEAVQILDWYHACEHLWATGKTLHGEGTQACKTFVESLKALLWESKIDELLGQLDQARKRLRQAGKRNALKGLCGYIENHRARMDYKKYRDQGLDIGSGAVEGVCKNLVHARMKRGSPRWSYQGSQAMLSLRSCYANHDQPTLWNHRPLLVN